MSDRFSKLRRLRIEISERDRQVHRSAISDEIKTAPRRPARRRVWSKRVAGTVVALAVSLPVAAIASVDSVPGDPLYPIKKAVEPLWTVVDPQVGARHRIEELEVLVDSSAEIDVVHRQIDHARDALRDLEAPDLDRRLQEIIDTVHQRPADDVPTDVVVPPVLPDGPRDSPTTSQPASDEGGSDTDTTTPHRDDATTTTLGSDRPPPVDRPPSDG